MKLSLKPNATKQLFFREMLEALIAHGYDISLEDHQTVISIYLPEGGFSLMLNINGTWTRQ